MWFTVPVYWKFRRNEETEPCLTLTPDGGMILTARGEADDDYRTVWVNRIDLLECADESEVPEDRNAFLELAKELEGVIVLTRC